MDHSTPTKSYSPILLLRTLTIVAILLLDIKLADGKNFPPASIILSAITLLLLSSWWFGKLKKGTGLPRTPLTLPIILLFLVAIISTIFSDAFYQSLDSALALLTLVCIFFLICDLVLYGWKIEIFELALLIFVGCLFILGLINVVSHYWTWYQLRVPGFPLFLLRYRITGVTAHPNLFAMLIYITMPFAVIRLANSKRFLLKIIWFTWLLLGTIVSYFVNSRGGMVAAAFTLVISIAYLMVRNGTPQPFNIRIWLWSQMKTLLVLSGYLAVFILIALVIQQASPGVATLRHGTGISAGRFRFWEVGLDMLRQNPIVGTGLSSYPIFYYHAIPTLGWIAGHAHNLYINIAGELGILGLLIFTWIILAIPFLFFHSSRQQKKSGPAITIGNRDLFFASAAGLVGFLVQALVDVVILTPHTIIPLVIVIIIALAAANLISPGRKIRSNFIPVTISIIFLVLLITRVLLQNYAHQLQIDGRNLASNGMWESSIENLEQASALDPKLDFYDEQLGFAQGYVYEVHDDQSVLQEAITIYPDAIDDRPFWAPNYLNYAALLEKNDQRIRALNVLESIPENWFTAWFLPAMILGDRLENTGEIDRARILFELGLENRPGMADTVICRRSMLCKELSRDSDQAEIYQLHIEMADLIEKGEYDHALTLQEHLSFEEIPLLIWIDRAYAHILLKDYAAARYEIKIADELGAINHEEYRSYMAFVVSEFLTQVGEFNQAERILSNFVNPKVDYRYYDLAIFNRVGFPELLLPSVNLLTMNNYDQMIFEKLSLLYRMQGRDAEAEWAGDLSEELEELLDE